jgi:hypothetical protein
MMTLRPRKGNESARGAAYGRSDPIDPKHWQRMRNGKIG